MMAIQLYYPLLMQGIQGVSAMRSGQIIAPFGLLMAFVGIPTGFLLAFLFITSIPKISI